MASFRLIFIQGYVDLVPVQHHRRWKPCQVMVVLLCINSGQVQPRNQYVYSCLFVSPPFFETQNVCSIPLQPHRPISMCKNRRLPPNERRQFLSRKPLRLLLMSLWTHKSLNHPLEKTRRKRASKECCIVHLYSNNDFNLRCLPAILCQVIIIRLMDAFVYVNMPNNQPTHHARIPT